MVLVGTFKAFVPSGADRFGSGWADVAAAAACQQDCSIIVCVKSKQNSSESLCSAPTADLAFCFSGGSHVFQRDHQAGGDAGVRAELSAD